MRQSRLPVTRQLAPAGKAKLVKPRGEPHTLALWVRPLAALVETRLAKEGIFRTKHENQSLEDQTANLPNVQVIQHPNVKQSVQLVRSSTANYINCLTSQEENLCSPSCRDRRIWRCLQDSLESKKNSSVPPSKQRQSFNLMRKINTRQRIRYTL